MDPSSFKQCLTSRYLAGVICVKTYKHHYHWQNSPSWVIAFLGIFTCLEFPTVFFYRGSSSALRSTPQPGGRVSVFMSPSDRVAHLYTQAQGSPFVAFYDSQSCGGIILSASIRETYIRMIQTQNTRLHTQKQILQSAWFTLRHWYFYGKLSSLQSDNAFHLYSGGDRFESLPEHQLSWSRFSVGFPLCGPLILLVPGALS
jgi:hypothetical protein